MLNLNDLKKMDKDDLLHLMGLETRKGPADWVLPVMGAFSVGLLVGAGLGLLLAPKPGQELRNDLRSRLQTGGQQGAQAGGNAQQRPESMARSA
jgi:hypothetical protein